MFFLALADDVQRSIAVHSSAQSLYEVIPPAARTRTYFDLEYCRVANQLRTASRDDAVVSSILDGVDHYFREHGLVTCVDRAASVVLDAYKFSQHVIVHLSNSASLDTFAVAKAICAHVIAHMPEAIKQVNTAAGLASTVVDQAVYSKTQQLRIAGCVKVGSNRVLRVLQPKGEVEHARGTLHAAVERTISNSMGSCRITGCALHASRGTNHNSLYVYTTSNACAHAQHRTNRALAELDCAKMRWRILCRGQCKPGAWHQLPALCQVPASDAPAWLKEHCAK